MKNQKKIEAFINEALVLQTEEAREAGALGYMARMLVQATMPHSKPKDSSFTRKNGGYSLTMRSDPAYGLPYGSIPRLLMSWITTEALRTKSPELILGDNLSQFMRELDLVPTGGRWGSITRLRNQIKRLITCTIHFKYTFADSEEELSYKNLNIVSEASLFWRPQKAGLVPQGELFESSLTLSHEFFKEVVSRPIVYRTDVLKLLKSSSMAVDLYIWTTYRNSYARKSARIPWQALQMQFGAGYPLTPKGKFDFKRKFLEALKKVALVYPSAGKLKDKGENLLFVPGDTDVPKLSEKRRKPKAAALPKIRR